MRPTTIAELWKDLKIFFTSLMISVTVKWVYQIFAALWVYHRPSLVYHQVLKSLITKITPSNHEYTNRYIKWSIKSFAKKLTFSVHKKKLCSATQKNHYFRKLPIIFYEMTLNYLKDVIWMIVWFMRENVIFIIIKSKVLHQVKCKIIWFKGLKVDSKIR